MRWPGLVKPGTIVNDIFSHEDWVPTLMAAAGDPEIKEKLKAGHSAAGKTFKTLSLPFTHPPSNREPFPDRTG